MNTMIFSLKLSMLRVWRFFFDFVFQFSEYRNNCPQNQVKGLGKTFKNAITQCFCDEFPKLIVDNRLYKKDRSNNTSKARNLAWNIFDCNSLF